MTDLNRKLGRKVPLDDVNKAMRYGFEKTFNVTLREDKLTEEEKEIINNREMLEMLPLLQNLDRIKLLTFLEILLCGNMKENSNIFEIS